VSGPWTFDQAWTECLGAAKAQEQAEKNMREAARAAAMAEERYRKALAAEIVRQHAEEGVAWTVAPDLARGNAKVAELRRQRDIEVGVREALTQASWRRTADRKDAQRFADWSQRRELAEGYGDGTEPDWSPPHGRGVPPNVDPETGEVRERAAA
jgi:hypothetical protein